MRLATGERQTRVLLFPEVSVRIALEISIPVVEVVAACTAVAVSTAAAPAWGPTAGMDIQVVALAQVTVHGPVPHLVWQKQPSKK